jgi:hypothetical protein
MPRSYSFDHFTSVAPPDVRRTARSVRPKRATRAQPEGEVHYGRKNAATVEMIEAHGMERELQRVIRSEARKKKPARAKRTTRQATQGKKTAKRKTAARTTSAKRRKR